MIATLTKEEEAACELLGMNKEELLKAKQREIDSLSDEEKNICRMMGVRPEDYARTKSNKDKRGAVYLSNVEKDVCRMMGVRPEDYARTKNSENIGAASNSQETASESTVVRKGFVKASSIW